jgi:hypothetical protein
VLPWLCNEVKRTDDYAITFLFSKSYLSFTSTPSFNTRYEDLPVGLLSTVFDRLSYAWNPGDKASSSDDIMAKVKPFKNV